MEGFASSLNMSISTLIRKSTVCQIVDDLGYILKLKLNVYDVKFM